MQNTRKKIELFYLDYFNNYLTVEKFAKDNNFTVLKANKLINLGRKINNSKIELTLKDTFSGCKFKKVYKLSTIKYLKAFKLMKEKTVLSHFENKISYNCTIKEINLIY